MKNPLLNIAEVELVYRRKINRSDKVQITSSLSAYDVFRSVWDDNKIDLLEQFNIILLDQSNHCLGISTITSGGIASCPVDVRLIFATALKARATQLIGAHNHPSGTLSPSDSDVTMSQKLVEAGKILDLKFLDHLIVTSDGYYSFADHGLIPG